MKKFVMFAVACLLAAIGFAQAPLSAVSSYCQKNQKDIISRYFSLLSIPNEASDEKNIRMNADWIMDALRKSGLTPRLLKVQDAAAPPYVYAEFTTPNAKRTLLFYAHYDGQPANAEDWTVTQPWKPVFRNPETNKNMDLAELTFPLPAELRIYGRSASDDKAGVMAIITAFEAVRATHQPITTNIKLLFEGEEEAGSPHMKDFTAQNKDLLKADAWILIDGPLHPSGKKLVDFGVRGDANVNITVYGPVRPLHSGHYGNWAPNPAMRLVQLLASMKDASGHVLIKGWYDDVTPLTDVELRAIADAPSADDELKAELGIAKPDGGGKSLLELLMEPSLNINGIRSADVADRARNVIPSTAQATLDLRLVKGNDVNKQYGKLLNHIRAQGYVVIDHDPTIEERRANPMIAQVRLAPGGYNAQRTDMNLDISFYVVKAVQSTSKEPIVVVPSSGGSLPLSIVEQNVGVPLINVPLCNHDNNQHAENENLRLQNFWDGIETIAALYTH